MLCKENQSNQNSSFASISRSSFWSFFLLTWCLFSQSLEFNFIGSISSESSYTAFFLFFKSYMSDIHLFSICISEILFIVHYPVQITFWLIRFYKTQLIPKHSIQQACIKCLIYVSPLIYWRRVQSPEQNTCKQWLQSFFQWNSRIMCKCANGNPGSAGGGKQRKYHRTTKLNFKGHRKGLQTDKIDRYWGEKKLKAQKNVKLKICVSLSKIFGWR